MRSSTLSLLKNPSCQARGQIVLDRIPTLIPMLRRLRNKGPTSGSVNVCGSQKSKYAVSRSASCSSPASVNRSATPALCWWSRLRPQIVSPAWWSLAALTGWSSSPASRTAWASASDSAWKSMSCHRVRVPPQSKMTASMLIPRNLSSAPWGRAMGSSSSTRSDSLPSGCATRRIATISRGDHQPLNSRMSGLGCCMRRSRLSRSRELLLEEVVARSGNPGVVGWGFEAGSAARVVQPPHDKGAVPKVRTRDPGDLESYSAQALFFGHVLAVSDRAAMVRAVVPESDRDAATSCRDRGRPVADVRSRQSIRLGTPRACDEPPTTPR